MALKIKTYKRLTEIKVVSNKLKANNTLFHYTRLRTIAWYVKPLYK